MARLPSRRPGRLFMFSRPQGGESFMSCIHNHYGPERLAELATDARWSVDEVAGLLAFCIGHERAGERGPCEAVSITWTEAFELAGCLGADVALVPAARRTAAAAVLAEFGE